LRRFRISINSLLSKKQYYCFEILPAEVGRIF
jgi:hypothetical protein